MSRVLRTDNHIAPLLLAIGLLLPGCTVQPWQTLDQSQPLELRILHTNDMHSHIAGIDNYGNACVADADCRGGRRARFRDSGTYDGKGQTQGRIGEFKVNVRIRKSRQAQYSHQGFRDVQGVLLRTV